MDAPALVLSQAHVSTGRPGTHPPFLTEAKMNETLHGRARKDWGEIDRHRHDLQMQMLEFALRNRFRRAAIFSPARYILEQFIEFRTCIFFRNSWSCGCTAIPATKRNLESHTHLMKKVRENPRECFSRRECAQPAPCSGITRLAAESYRFPRMWRLAISCARKKAAAPEFVLRAAAFGRR